MRQKKIEHYNAILIEDLKSKMELIVEGLDGLKTSLSGQISEFREEVNGRFCVIEAVVRKNSGDISELKSDVRKNSEGIAELKSDVRKNSEGISELKTDVKSIRSEMKAMEGRLSDKIDNIGNRLDEHESKPIDLAHPIGHS